MDTNKDLNILEEELKGINQSVSKAKDCVDTIITTRLKLNKIKALIKESRSLALENYDTEYKTIVENIKSIDTSAQEIPYKRINCFSEEDIGHTSSINYNFKNITYHSLVIALPKSPPITKKELEKFIKELDKQKSKVILQITQLNSYQNKLERIIDNLSATAIACYLSS